MDSQHHQKNRDKVEGKQNEGKVKQGGKEGQIQANQPPPPTASPPSASSSPSHEFSFTISLHPTATAVPDKAKAAPPSIAIDLSPADDIFFHGHLLPLHLLSHLPVSPRSSTNSLDSFTLPIRELLEDQNPNRGATSTTATPVDTTTSSNNGHDDDPKSRGKSKSFSLFGLSKWRKGCEVREREDRAEKQRRKKVWVDVRHVVKRYMSMVLSSLRGRRENLQLRGQPYSYSGNLSMRGKRDQVRGKRGEFSAPASMRTSPTNSGLLVATGTVPTSTSNSTMEELQAAIQAAINHCKNSIAMEEKNSK